jgi:hypothetical protein
MSVRNMIVVSAACAVLCGAAAGMPVTAGAAADGRAGTATFTIGIGTSRTSFPVARHFATMNGPPTSGEVLLYESFTGPPGMWGPGGGTSAACPLLAGIVAIADQYAHTRLGLINPALYRLEQEHAPGIVDVTQGDNTVRFTFDGTPLTVEGYPAKPGYDLVAGVGTVDAARFVPELAAADLRFTP